MAQKIVQYQAVLQLAAQAPQLYNLPLLHRQMLDVLGIKNAAKLVPMEDDQKPTDPITENMNAFKGKPLKAFIYQDHQAHITVHMATFKDPQIAAVMGQNPQAQMIHASMMAHISEHLGFEYRRQMEDMIGVPIPYNDDPENDEPLPEEVELQISRLAAPAAQKLLMEHQALAAQQQALQAAQDPIVQMQQQELAIKAKEVEIKERKLMADAAAKADQLDIEKERIATQERIAGMQVGAKVAKDKAELESNDQLEGMKLGVEIARTKEMANATKEQAKKGK